MNFNDFKMVKKSYFSIKENINTKSVNNSSVVTIKR